MAREIPEAVRAAAGLAATVLDEARKLPETLPGLPVRVLGMAMQVSMKLQQHYAGLVARGDELFTGIRGENEPGLATFDEEEPAPAAPGFHDSAFDRATISDEDLDFADGEATDLVSDSGLGLSLQVEASAEVLEEFAIEEMVEDRPVTEDAEAVENALLESDRAVTEPAPPTEADVLTPDGEIATTEATVTDEGVAAAEEPAEAPAAEPAEEPTEGAAADDGETEAPAVIDTAGDAEASARAAAAAPIVVHEGEIAVDDAMGSGADTEAPEAPTAGGRRLTAPATPPIDGYDDFSIAQLRGRLRGYAAPTVQKLLEYEEATQGREPYLRMLRNRLEKLATQ